MGKSSDWWKNTRRVSVQKNKKKSFLAILFTVYNRPLAEHMCSETDGHFRRLLTLIITGVRDESGEVDADLAKEQADILYAAGEGKLGTDEDAFNKVLAHGSFEHLRLVFDEYKQLSGQTIEHAIDHELDGDLKDAIKAIGMSISNSNFPALTKFKRLLQF